MINYKTILEVKIQNQTIVLDPPISEARAFWYKKLHEQLEVICGLLRVEAYRYEKFKQSEAQAGKDKTYQTLILRMSQDVLNHAYMTLEKQITGAEEYVKTWKSYQTLWDIDASHIFNILDENIEKWQQILNEIRQGRKTFDNSETEKAFGAIIIYYGGVQAKVNNKYDQWHRDILNKFGSTLLENLMSFNQKVQKARRKLETLSIDVSDDVTMFVTEIQEMKHSHKVWGEEFEKYKSGYKLLISQRYQFPQEWLYIELVEGEWTAFKQLYGKKAKIMEEKIPELQKKIIDEERVALEKIKDVELQWKNEKPEQSNVLPSRALDILAAIGTKISTTKAEWVRICKAKELLEMELGDPKRLDSLEEQLNILRQCWQFLQKIWSTCVEPVNDTPFSAYVNKKVKDLLDSAAIQMKEAPAVVKGPMFFDEFRKIIENYKKVNNLVGELKSEAMKHRHWRDLMQKLHL